MCRESLGSSGPRRQASGWGSSPTSCDGARRAAALRSAVMSSDDVPRLTSLSHGGGCACKIGPEDLGAVLRQLPPVMDPTVLVGFSTSDDAAIVKLAPDLAAVATVDFFTPIVDDPRDFGRIAATNAISDVYAMGGRPLF